MNSEDTFWVAFWSLLVIGATALAVISGAYWKDHNAKIVELIENGVDDRKRIIGVQAPHPVLFNLPIGFIDRFRSQLELIDVQFERDPVEYHIVV